MSLAYNAERGEVPLTVGGVDLVIAAEMGRLASLSGRLNCQSFMELYLKLAGVEIGATVAAVEILAVKGDATKAIAAMSIADLPACKDAFLAAMLHHADKPSGNAQTAKEATT
ncbi:hypothetical protein SAMN03159423_4872 [Bradyrhizobium sp. NFR13]|uniref:hypothetical protein n=1 Tax=Bradyrhizobium sp. NFR13 TaxID=1566285 RepID=UPI0008DF8F44|nr:hypothetical protein [Bradyrhizobium sp. NFR13]SFM00653.1 hypothetical protein SAMN03159423_4872 [Bradyrhizobium sp. NFR13]